ncbi:MAG: DNA gyrase subunit A [Eubacteriaceae bacterium]|nr:DNA gyrase subunit A [Eubacteriaceae bacterium]
MDNMVLFNDIEPVDIAEEMERSFIDYAMSVIVDRALPDVRDGLKPVHRRILYAMDEMGVRYNTPYRKSARIIGDVMGKYHPHGDSAIYDSMARLSQPFSTRYLLVDGQGNFGSVDGDSPAAMRYTEARMSRLASEMLRDIGKETIDYTTNFDEELLEPTVLPSRFPNLLVNGSSGIAVGMTTNVPPHNLGEVIDAVIALMANPKLSTMDLAGYIKGPDFPTGGIIMGKEGIMNAYATGRGRITLRSKTEIEPSTSNRQRIVVTEIPYMVNKAKLVEKIAELAAEKRIAGISTVNDYSDRTGMRITIELKKDANPQIVLNQLFKFTQMQDTFGVIMLALVDNKPQVLNLKEMLEHYIEFQKEIIVRRTVYDLRKAQERLHILEGYIIALDNIDEIIAIIRGAYDDAEEQLQKRFALSEIQAKAIMDMRLGRLQGLEREKIDAEHSELSKLVTYYNEILSSDELVIKIIGDELTEIRNRFADERRTAFEVTEEYIDLENLIEVDDVVVTITHVGYVKRISLNTYKAQKRGGKGVNAHTTREDDFIKHLFMTTTHHHIMFFSNKGKVYRLKAHELPDAGRTAKGIAIVNLLPLEPGEKITAIFPVKEFTNNQFLLMQTKLGMIKKIELDKFANLRKNGLVCIVLKDDDELIDVRLTDGGKDIILGTLFGYSLRFSESEIRPMGRSARGVMSIKLTPTDEVIGMDIIHDDEMILTISENGMGKITAPSLYRLAKRNGRGLINYKPSKKTGLVRGICSINKDKHDLMIITSEGKIIRMDAATIKETRRGASGTILCRMDDNVKIASIAKVNSYVDEDGDE